MSKNIFAYVAASDPGSYPASVSHWLMAISNLTSDNGTITTDDWSGVISNIKSANPGKPILLGIGGTDAHWTAMVANSTYRANFISNVQSDISTYGLDGVVYDWEYPSSVADGDNFISLLSETSAAFTTELLGYAAGNADTYVSYVDVAASAAYCNFIFLMGYDYNWSTLGHHSQLYLSEIFATENNVTYKMTGDNMVDLWISEVDEEDVEKIVLGLPFYGYYYENSHQMLTYATLVASYIDLNNWYSCYDSVAMVPWLEKWISGDTYHHIFYENETSVAAKANYAISSGIGGLGIWLIEYDNSHDLLEAMATILLEEDIEAPAVNIDIAVLVPSIDVHSEAVVYLPAINLGIAAYPCAVVLASTDSQFILLKFNMSNIIGKTIKKAILKLYITAHNTQYTRIGIKRITTTWDESTVTYNTKPTLDSEIYWNDVILSQNNKWTSINITDFVQDVAAGATHNGMWLYITNDISDYAATTFSSKEGSYPPELDIYYVD